MKKLFRSVLAMLAVVALAVPSAMAQNLLGNPGFEDPVAEGGPPFIGFWQPFAGGGASSARAEVDPLSGVGHMSLNTTVNNTFAGMFQDVPGLSPGQPVTFSVWHKSATLPFDIISELRIEWRNSVSDTEITRTDNLTTPPTGDYSLLSLTAPVPAGVDTARVVYAIQTFSNEMLPDLGTVYIDDASVTVIPEPATLALVGLSLVGLAGMRRRS